MGTYTTNYQLYMPTIGETGWGTLINGNYQIIDTTMKSLSNRITAVENEVNGALSCTSVTTSGKITGNGGIAGTTGTFSGAVTAASFNGVILKSSGTITVKPSSTFIYIPPAGSSGTNTQSLTILPLYGTAKYTGTLTLKSISSSSGCGVRIFTGTSGNFADHTVYSGASTTISFSNIPYMVISANNQSAFANVSLPVLS